MCPAIDNGTDKRIQFVLCGRCAFRAAMLSPTRLATTASNARRYYHRSSFFK